MVTSVALLGAGKIAASHLRAVEGVAGVRAVAVADIDPERAQACAGRFGLQAYTDYRRMIDETRPGIVIIALPHFLHRDAALYAAQRGCHLLLEKPMAISAAECTEILETADRHGVVTFVGHTQQYLAHNRTAKSLIRKANLGKLIQINENRHGPYFLPGRPAWFLDPAKSGGGIVFNLGAHCIDKIQWLTDSRIARVRAALSFEAEGCPEAEGSAVMLLTTDAGVPCTVNLSGYDGVWSEETELVFTRGMVKISNRNAVWISENGSYREVAADEAAPDEDPFRLQLLDLLACIREGRQPYCSAEYGRSVVRVIEAAYASHREQREIAL